MAIAALCQDENFSTAFGNQKPTRVNGRNRTLENGMGRVVSMDHPIWNLRIAVCLRVCVFVCVIPREDTSTDRSIPTGTDLENRWNLDGTCNCKCQLQMSGLQSSNHSGPSPPVPCANPQANVTYYWRPNSAREASCPHFL